MPRDRVVAAMAAAAASVLVFDPGFRPFESRAVLVGAAVSHVFTLPERQPLLLEFELTLHADSTPRPEVVVAMNGIVVATVQAPVAYAVERRHLQVPLHAVHEATNQVSLRARPDLPGVSLEARLRVHNYSGIAPDFPRAAVVPDEAVAHRAAGETWPARLGLWLTLGIVSLVAMTGFERGSVWLGASPRWSWLAAGGPVAAAAYSLATPRHLWVPATTLAALAGVPWLAGLGLCAAVRARRRLAPALFMAAVTAGLLEATLRIVNAVRPSFVFYADDYNRYRGRPGARHFDDVFNSRGFNDIERTTDRPPGIGRRVVAIGDSFAVGVVPRPANFLALVERTLGAHAGTEVINLGVSGTGPRDYLAILVDEGLAYRPDTVLVCVYVGNDFEVRRRRLHEYSYGLTLLRVLWRLGASTASLPIDETAPAAYVDEAPSLPRERFLEIAVDRSWVYEPGSERVAAAVAQVADTLDAMRRLSAGAGAALLVVLVPDELQVDAALRAAVAAAKGVAPEWLAVDQPNRLLGAALGGRDVRVLDLLEPMRRAAQVERLYKPQDTHWNLAGNRLAAAAIAGALAQP